MEGVVFGRSDEERGEGRRETVGVQGQYNTTVPVQDLTVESAMGEDFDVFAVGDDSHASRVTRSQELHVQDLVTVSQELREKEAERKNEAHYCIYTCTCS